MSIERRDDSAGQPGWQAALALSVVIGSLATSCMMPFVAVAVMAAATMSARGAAMTVVGVWAVNQSLGFALLGYPLTPYALGWGAALGGASLMAMLFARMVVGGRGRSVPTMLAAFGAAFVAYEGALFAFALLAGGTGTFAPSIVAAIALNDATWFAGLWALHAVLTRAAPRTFGPSLSLRPA